MDQERSVQRLMWIVGAAVFIDTMFYAVVSPMLPSLSHQLGLSKAAAGLLTASYPIGMLVASIPGGVIAIRIGPRLTVCLGLGLLAISTLGFAFAQSGPLLDGSRMLEGVGGACTWAAGLAWLNAATPVAKHGETVGKAMAAGIGGALLGPLIGSVATAVGREWLFLALVVIVAGLIALTLTVPDEVESSEQGLGYVLKAMWRRPVLVAGWLVALPGMASGIATVLGSLRMHALGAGAFVIGAVFLVGALIETLLSPWVGRISDRHGRLLPLRSGMIVLSAAIVGFTLPTQLGLVIPVMLVLFTALGLFWAPSMAMLADAGDRIGLDQAHAAALMNLTWAAGQIVGSAGGGAAGQALGDTPVALVFAVLTLTTFALVRNDESQAGQPPTSA